MWRSFTQQYFLIHFLIYFHFLFNFYTEGHNRNLVPGAVDIEARILSTMEKKRKADAASRK